MRTYNRAFRAEDATGRPIAGAHVTLWDSPTGGSQITTGIQDLTGATITGGVLVCDTWGYPPGFQDSMDRPDLWAIGSDTGTIPGVDRVHLEPDDTDVRLSAFQASVGQIGGPAGPLDGSGLIPSAQIPGGGGGGGGPSLSGTVTAETTYGVASAAGSAATASRGDHTHGTPSLASATPTVSAAGDTAAVGTATTPARADHLHGREAFGAVTAQTAYAAASANGSATTLARSDHAHGTPALTSSAATSSAVGDAAAVGTATAPARADHLHGREAYGTPGASAVGDTASAGAATTTARSDHRHSRESFGTVTAQTTFGASSGSGSATTPARSDHTHGTPAAPTPASIGAATDHGYSPADYSLLAWVGDPGYIAGVVAPSAGILHLMKVKVPTAMTINNIVIQVSGSGVSLTSGQNFAALFDTSGNRLGITADQSSSWATNGSKVCALTSGVAVSAGYVYVGLLWNGTTIPNMGRYAVSTQFNNANLSLTGLRFCQFGSGLTAMPSSITMASTAIDATAAFWAAVS